MLDGRRHAGPAAVGLRAARQGRHAAAGVEAAVAGADALREGLHDAARGSSRRRRAAVRCEGARGGAGMRIRRGAVRVALRACRAPLASHRISVRGKRKMYEAFTAVTRPPGGTRDERLTIAGVPVFRLRPPGDVAAGTLIYLHGGAYALGSA